MAVPGRYWWFGGAMAVLAAVLGALIIISPQVIPQSIKLFECNNQTATRSLSAQEKELYDEAWKLKQTGVYSEALKKLDELISKRPDYVYAYILRGRIYLENLKQYQNAVDEFRKGSDKDPANKYALYDLGLSYYYLGDLNLAIDFNDSALAQDRDLIIAIYNSAIYHVDYGEKYNNGSYYLKAIELYENVMKRDREFAASSMFNLAALYARLAKEEKNKSTRDEYVKKAIELLDRAIEKEGVERLKKITGEISVPYGEDLKTIYQDPAYETMIEKWKQKSD